MGRRAASRGSLEDLVGQVADYAIIGLDPEGIIQTWNLGAERVKGYTAEEAIGRSFAMFYTEEDRRAGLPLTLLHRGPRDGRVEHTGWRVRKDGTRFWGDVVITALHDEDGNLTGFAKVTRDLTEQHELEDALRASEERLRLLVGQVADYAIIALDPQGIIETWNLGAERVKGYTAEEAIGRSFAMFYTEEDRRAGLPLQLLADAREHGAGRAHRLAGAQGRLPVLGRRGHHRAARRRRQPHRLRQGHPRPHRPQGARGRAGRVLRRLQPRLPHAGHRAQGVRRRHPRRRRRRPRRT